MRRVIGYLGSISLIIAVLYLSVAISAFDQGFYEKEYEKNLTAETIKMEKNGLMAVTLHIIDYLRDKNDDLRITAEVDGVGREFFSERELEHMVDVKKLLITGRTLGGVCALIFAASLIYLAGKRDIKTLAAACIVSILCFAVITAVLCFAVYLDFDRAFTLFHELFFSNDLWRLDPETELLINIVPLQFFIDIAKRISVIFALFLSAVVSVSLLALRLNRRS